MTKRRLIIQAHSALFGAALTLGIVGHTDQATVLAIIAILMNQLEFRWFATPSNTESQT